MSQRGAFVVIEGLDRSGKTTQVQRLKDELAKAGKDVQLLRFPGTKLLFFAAFSSTVSGSTNLHQTEQPQLAK